MNINYKVFEKELKKEKITSCIIFQKEIFFEYYKNRKMSDKVHKVNSISKSVLSILLGIAIDKGYFKDGVDTLISKYFPNVPEYMKDINLDIQGVM
ncbi:hypothetical protein [Peribacillus alkalitolerans]|uniref:hypothetical protein n=1 Tax=Peribacillus alkalitolerans TaxID=1550385 RepID=UPI0013D524B9|nr:hypothetical protein [Peribacillus alkalitolerans]